MKYESPKLVIIHIDDDDVVRTSGNIGGTPDFEDENVDSSTWL